MVHCIIEAWNRVLGHFVANLLDGCEDNLLIISNVFILIGDDFGSIS